MEIRVRKAIPQDVIGICQMCTRAWWATYTDLYSHAYIEHRIAALFSLERVRQGISESEGWNGWWVAEAAGKIIGAGGGGLIASGVGEIHVLYVDPERRSEGIGTRLLQAISDELNLQGAHEQWVWVAKGNSKGIPFYEARGFVVREEQSYQWEVTGEQITSLRLWRRV